MSEPKKKKKSKKKTTKTMVNSNRVSQKVIVHIGDSIKSKLTRSRKRQSKSASSKEIPAPIYQTVMHVPPQRMSVNETNELAQRQNIQNQINHEKAHLILQNPSLKNEITKRAKEVSSEIGLTTNDDSDGLMYINPAHSPYVIKPIPIRDFEEKYPNPLFIPNHPRREARAVKSEDEGNDEEVEGRDLRAKFDFYVDRKDIKDRAKKIRSIGRDIGTRYNKPELTNWINDNPKKKAKTVIKEIRAALS